MFDHSVLISQAQAISPVLLTFPVPFAVITHYPQSTIVVCSFRPRSTQNTKPTGPDLQEEKVKRFARASGVLVTSRWHANAVRDMCRGSAAAIKGSPQAQPFRGFAPTESDSKQAPMDPVQ